MRKIKNFLFTRILGVEALSNDALTDLFRNFITECYNDETNVVVIKDDY